MIDWFLLSLLFTGINGACNSCGSLHGSSRSVARAESELYKVESLFSYNRVTYQASSDHIENPGRGFYKMIEAWASRFESLTIQQLDKIRRDDGINLALRVYILDSFVHHHISEDFLHKIKTDLSVAKSAGWMLALRFHYTHTSHVPDHPPYGDATKAYMLAHIKQLGPIWKEYEGVISVIQAGFIGMWGEWAYSTYFGDSAHPASNGVDGLTPQNWRDRGEVLKAIMDNSPKSIHVQVRTPDFKTIIWKHTDPTRLQDEEQQNHVGRTGHHNDCFLASDSDEGTYHDIAQEKQYLAADSLYVPVGGETCRVSAVKHGTRRSDCPTALQEMKKFHWSFVHISYEENVIANWKSQGCFNSMHRDLGYRLSLKESTFPKSVKRGDNLCFHIVLSSVGYAAPYKPWALRLVLQSHSGGHHYSAHVHNVVPQGWIPGHDYNIDGSLEVPSNMPEGSYKAYLAVYDPLMDSHADYYVLFANNGVPDFSSGLNDLQATVQISGSHSAHSDCSKLTAWSPPTHSTYARVFGSSGHGAGTGTGTGSGGCQAVAVPNHSFEDTRDSKWGKYTNGYAYTSSDHHSGSHAIKVSNGGADYAFTFSSPITKFTFSAYSKRTGSSSRSDDSDYSLYCDLTQTDGHYDYGEHKAFDQTDRSWQEATLHVTNTKGITKAHCYLLYRHFTDGSVLFDDVSFNAGC